MISSVKSTTNGHFRRRLGLIFPLIGFFIFSLAPSPVIWNGQQPDNWLCPDRRFSGGPGVICLGDLS
jgi:hypothetical protein